MEIRARWRPYLSSTPCPAVDRRHTLTVGSNSGQEAPAASLRPSSSGRVENVPQQNFRLPFTGRPMHAEAAATSHPHETLRSTGIAAGFFFDFFPGKFRFASSPHPTVSLPSRCRLGSDLGCPTIGVTAAHVFGGCKANGISGA